jgi:hypothetical protein
MTHTPGPWKFSESKLASGWGLVVDSHENIIANVNTETGPDIPPLVSTKMPCKANGMVIAAAPDMLAALKYNFMVLDDPNPGNEKRLYALALTKAAIAKAEGILAAFALQEGVED